MYHPKEESENVKWEDTRPIPKKAKTAEELGREFLQKHKLDDVDIENHYQIRTLPGPDGMDVNTHEDLFAHGQGTQHQQTWPVAYKLAEVYQGNYKQWELHNWRFQNRNIANQPQQEIKERDPEE